MKKVLCLIVLLFSFSLLPAFAVDTELQQIQNAIKEKGAQWVAAENPIFNLSPEERKNLLGLIKPQAETDQYLLNKDEIYGPLSDWDWRSHNGYNWMTPVRNQLNCGSCVMFACVGAMEGQMKISTNTPTQNPNLSEQFVLSCGSGSCSGWYNSACLGFLVSTGTTNEACFPYVASKVPCSNRCSDWPDHISKLESWSWNLNNVNALKTAIQNGPVACGMDVYADFYGYSGGVYQHTTGGYEGGHAVVLVGWQDTYSCWICKNSWGGSWGESGYFRILWGNCDIGTDNGSVDYSACLQDCNELDGTYCNGVNLEQRDYYCDDVSQNCLYTVTSTQNCTTLDGWVCNEGVREYRDYYGCNNNQCAYNVTQSENCEAQTGWYCTGNGQEMEHRIYFCRSSDVTCQHWISDTIDCDDQDGWFCNPETLIFEYHDYSCSDGGCTFVITEYGGICEPEVPLDSPQMLIFLLIIGVFSFFGLEKLRRVLS